MGRRVDPEIVGLSDVADDELRRRATLRLLERFRAHELTDAQAVWEQLPVAGLKYSGIENDLRPVLKERADLCEDVLRFTINVIEKCSITSLHDDLADLVLDPSAPLLGGSRLRTPTGRRPDGAGSPQSLGRRFSRG